MVSDKILVSDKGNECAGMDAAMEMIKKAAEYVNFSAEEIEKLQKLADEMVVGSATILNVFSGEMWVDTTASYFNINLEMKGTFNQEERDEFIDMTRDKKNVMPKGFFAKLGVLISDALTSEYALPVGAGGVDMEGSEVMWNAIEIAEMMKRMEKRDDPEEKKLHEDAVNALDEIADDIQVSAHSERVLVTVKKALPKKK